MQALSHLTQGRAVQVLFFDIDDTFTHEGQVCASGFAALERWQAAGRHAVAVTGRPAGWCDHVARMWPIDAVIGENGAFWFAYHRASKRLERQFLAQPEPGQLLQARLQQAAQTVLAQHPGARLSADQPYRLFDVAIDFAEDIAPALPLSEAERIAATLRSLGLNAKVSSIHVNAWFGEHNKYSACVRWLKQAMGLEEAAAHALSVYVGDSPNDEPMFAKFPLSVGVANVQPFLASMATPPAYLTRQAASAGFCELVDHLLSEH